MWNFEIISKRISVCTCVIPVVVSDDLGRIGIGDASVLGHYATSAGRTCD
jgi:hypothetical protein